MLKNFWFWVVIIFALMQLFSLNTPASLPIKEAEKLQAPQEVLTLLQRSCYDCHSSKVEAPWYYNVAPISWYTQLNVKNAREIVNFSKWNSYPKERQLKLLKKIPKAIVIRMPMQTYLYMHEEARVTKSEKELLTTWANELKERLK